MSESLQEAMDAEYGSWFRCELADGRVVYIGGCGECNTPWITDESEPPAIKGEWERYEL